MKHFYVFACCLICFASCKRDVTQAPPEIITGKRSYVWVRDTIQYLGNAQTAMQSMYAASDSNVYIVGNCEVSGGRMWRFDGIRWNAENIAVRGYLNSIRGSGRNDIWIVGGQPYFTSDSSQLVDSTLVIHFDGVSWRQVEVVPRRGELHCVDVVSPSILFAGGERGLLCRRDGENWQIHDLGSQFFFSSVAALSPNEAYAIGHVIDHSLPVDSSGSFLFKFDGTRWQKIDSTMKTPGAASPHMGIRVHTFDNSIYTVGPNVYRRNGISWLRLLEADVGKMFGVKSNHMFAIGNSIWHFNGFDWQVLASTFPMLAFDCYASMSDVFVVSNDNLKTVVLHGK